MGLSKASNTSPWPKSPKARCLLTSCELKCLRNPASSPGRTMRSPVSLPQRSGGSLPFTAAGRQPAYPRRRWPAPLTGWPQPCSPAPPLPQRLQAFPQRGWAGDRRDGRQRAAPGVYPRFLWGGGRLPGSAAGCFPPSSASELRLPPPVPPLPLTPFALPRPGAAAELPRPEVAAAAQRWRLVLLADGGAQRWLEPSSLRPAALSREQYLRKG